MLYQLMLLAVLFIHLRMWLTCIFGLFRDKFLKILSPIWPSKFESHSIHFRSRFPGILFAQELSGAEAAFLGGVFGEVDR